MKSFTFPLSIVDGDLAVDESPEEIIESEILSILQTRPFERVFRQNYGTPNFLLKKLDVNYLLIEINAALELSLTSLGFAQVSVEVDSEITQLQLGQINLVISYTVGNALIKSAFLVDLNIGY